MEIFITKNVGDFSQTVSVSGVKDVKEVLELYKGISNTGECKPNTVQHPEVVLDDGSVAVSGMTLSGEDGETTYNSKLLVGDEINLAEFGLSIGCSFRYLKRSYKSDLGDGTYSLRATPLSGNSFDLTIGDIKLLHKEFGEIINFWEE